MTLEKSLVHGNDMETPKSNMSKLSASPSPTASASTSATTPNNAQSGKQASPTSANAANSRRPPRKSTLTQQQKNQKRQRATQDQLVTLEIEFNKNATPTAATRERIAQEINMTERSVQIWFQNRRAKIKLLAKKSIETGEDCDAIPESMRNYLHQQAMELGKPLSRAMYGGPGLGYGPGMMFGGDAQQPQKVVIHHFQCRSLSIGSWRRVGQNAMDLVIFYSLGATPCLTYYINNEAAGYKIEFPFHFIKSINLENGQSENGMPARPAGLVVELTRPPNFYMDSNNQGGFAQCGDFTEDQQASKVLVHHLGGDPHTLSGQLAKLGLMDQFRTRHNTMYGTDSSAIAASAPVSPMFHRPASQPSAMAPPAVPVFRENGFGSLHPTRAMGHKRQRSRSVPTIPNFEYMNHPMPSFHIQQPSTTITDPSIFAPVPQHMHNLSPNGAPVGLRIDTAAGFGMDFRQYPQSAATTASASDFASPSLFHAQPASATGDANSVVGDMHGGYSFLHSPMIEASHMAGHPSASPLSALSLAHSPASAVDPVIANQSPPLSNMQRPASAADFLSMTNADQGVSGMADDGFMNEMYGANKAAHLNLPFRATGQAQSPQNQHAMLNGSAIDDELDMNDMIDFGIDHLDPNQLEGGNM